MIIYLYFIIKDKSFVLILVDIKIKDYDFVLLFLYILGLIKNGVVVEKKFCSFEIIFKGVGINYIIRMFILMNFRDYVYYSRYFRVVRVVVDVVIKFGVKVIVM